MEKKLKIIDGKINFNCLMDRCEHCCCGPFSGITDNIASVDGRPFDEIILTNDDYAKIYESGNSELIDESVSPITGKTYYKMKLKPDGSCQALKNGRCSINHYKPTLCKAFPFYFDMFTGLCAIMCDGFTDECNADLDECKESMDAARQMYEYWIKFYSEE